MAANLGERSLSTPTRRQGSSRTWPVAAVAGILTPPVVANAMKLLNILAQLGGFVSMAVMFAALILLGWFFGSPFSGTDPIRRRAGLAAWGGVGVGVVLNALFEELVFQRWAARNVWPSKVIYVEHNLWPFEFVMWLLIALVLMRLGAVLQFKNRASSARTS